MEHTPVLLVESVELLLSGPLLLRGRGLIVDATFGGGGHSRVLLQKSSSAVRVLAFDRDPAAVVRGAALSREYPDRFQLIPGNFADLGRLLDEAGHGLIDGLLLDIGLSSFQLEEAGRGFSFQSDGPLDMRMDPHSGAPAAEVVNQADCRSLAGIFRDFGEEPYAEAIARKIVAVREIRPLRTTRDLASLIEAMVPSYKKSRRHPATRVFQALRIFVNDELGALARGLESGLERLAPGGRMVIISYHSLEDRLVKIFSRRVSRGCVCPPRIPVCVCGGQVRAVILTKSGVRPGNAEVERNPRSRSACLRALEVV
ncbi:MAG: 16S rRNA (cytosine(1402)-N(4))-methyltransferase RsmH [Deltaproteobacteria bacterium]|nr:16S rRNA (cytosine(1402)-N(4))-methyltransferase RsmH [Deltaproteobacteria bacterium]